MSDVRDENKAPNTKEGNGAATRNIQAPLVKKEKNRTFENLTEEERIMVMMKESTEAYDPKHCITKEKKTASNKRARRMSDVRDENKAPNTKEGNGAATRNIQAPLVKKEKNRTFENLTEEERIMVMMKESTEAYDPKHMVVILQAVQAGRALHTELPTGLFMA
ncbi:hypothetical protein T07_12255 [Trichinella nelsoni]|uniref:Uncharacterized protein n=1 Tax=Trichinella nelsoni TaxID=6336 RepID=A0A0V0SKK4_9BILA|nr:hypothetical protein T07_12255 [Trichinella nelsoni]